LKSSSVKYGIYIFLKTTSTCLSSSNERHLNSFNHTSRVSSFKSQQTTKPGGRHDRTPAAAIVNGFFTVDATKEKLVVVVVAATTKADFGITIGKA